MSFVLLAASWLLAILFGLATLSFFLMGLTPQAIALLGMTLILLPPVRALVGNLAGQPVPWWVWGGLVALLLVALIPLGKINRATSIYKSPEVRQRFMQMYDDKMKAWPVPHEDLSVDTAYGRAHVIASGPREAPPILLLHASGVGGWSWSFNVEALSRDYRIFAIDTLGDAGKSELANVDHYPQNGQQQGELVAEIADKLGVEAAYVVGASEGGFIGTNYALYAPERVKKLVLIGPMGYAGTTESIVRIMLTQFFPLKIVRDHTIPWAFGDDPKVVGAFGNWMQLLMAEVTPRKARPVPFTAEQRHSLKMPVLLILGEKDHLVGDPEIAKTKVQDIPNLRVEVLESGHLIGAEQPERVSTLLIEFLGEE